MKRYKAIHRGYDGYQLREVGEVFEYGGRPGDWMKEVDDEGRDVRDDKDGLGAEETKRRPGRPPKAD